MIQRIVTTVIGLPLLILIIRIDSPLLFSGFVALVAVAASVEMCNMARQWGDRPISAVAIIGSVTFIAASHHLNNWSFEHAAVSLPILIGVILSLIWLLTRGHTGIHSSRWIATVCTGFFIGGFLFYAPLLRGLEQGRDWILFVILVTFTMDTFAFLFGKAIGRTPLAATISPAKTREGAVGGVLGAFGATILAVYLLDLDVTFWKTILISSTIGIAGQLGDLVESRLKRIAAVKDSGVLLPGHGGIMDRLDSIVFNLVLVYYLVL